jgi:hypothetical protein
MLVLVFLIPSLVGGALVAGCLTIADRMVRRAATPRARRRPSGLAPARPAKAPLASALSHGHGPALLTYLVVVWVVMRLLVRVGGDLRAHPLPFILFGLGLGLAQALPGWAAARRTR